MVSKETIRNKTLDETLWTSHSREEVTHFSVEERVERRGESLQKNL